MLQDICGGGGTLNRSKQCNFTVFFFFLIIFYLSPSVDSGITEDHPGLFGSLQSGCTPDSRVGERGGGRVCVCEKSFSLRTRITGKQTSSGRQNALNELCKEAPNTHTRIYI